MKLFNICEIILDCILLILLIYHICKREFKPLKSILVIFVLSFLPACLNAFFQIKINALSSLLYLLILFMALYLGSSLKFYDRYKWWDRVIHFLSGVSFVGFGIAIGAINTGVLKWGLLFFGFTFSITLHVFWEVCEYISDCLSHGNAQRWQKRNDSVNHVSEKAIQPAGLVDTMNDFICCIVGAALAVIVWCFIL